MLRSCNAVTKTFVNFRFEIEIVLVKIELEMQSMVVCRFSFRNARQENSKSGLQPWLSISSCGAFRSEVYHAIFFALQRCQHSSFQIWNWDCFGEDRAGNAKLVAWIFISKHDRKLEIWFANGCRFPLVARFVLKSTMQYSSHCNAVNIRRFRFEIEIVLVKIELEMQSWSSGFSLQNTTENSKSGSQMVVDFLLCCVSFWSLPCNILGTATLSTFVVSDLKLRLFRWR